MSGNTKDIIAVRNNAGKTNPAATAPMANAYANATVLEKIENLAATFRHRKCNETSSRFLFLNIKANDKSYQIPLEVSFGFSRHSQQATDTRLPCGRHGRPASPPVASFAVATSDRHASSPWSLWATSSAPSGLPQGDQLLILPGRHGAVGA
ncbi:hypothetical protein F2Q68_00020536 [Brassica cretica]|uniref:Uncharacterized protein n=2 Tax=Brassica cretica TaxID=69181 RepID=A0A8S9FTH6_BRACR|nr:hypothetical protein F2Q68_00020536 [Brassica cretica]